MDWMTEYYLRNRYQYPNPRNAFQRGFNEYYSSPDIRSRLSKGDSNRIRYELSGVPILGDFIRAADNTDYMNTYLRSHQMTWADVKNPSRLTGAGSSARAISNVGSTALYGKLLHKMYS